MSYIYCFFIFFLLLYIKLKNIFGGIYMSNRQTRRHPSHPLLPISYPSKTRIPDKKLTKSSYTTQHKKGIRHRNAKV